MKSENYQQQSLKKITLAQEKSLDINFINNAGNRNKRILKGLCI